MILIYIYDCNEEQSDVFDFEDNNNDNNYL